MFPSQENLDHQATAVATGALGSHFHFFISCSQEQFLVMQRKVGGRMVFTQFL